MGSRTQVTLDTDLDQRAKRRANQLGISFAEYVRRLISRDLEEPTQNGTLADLIGIGDSGGSDVAEHKDEYLVEAQDGR